MFKTLFGGKSAKVPHAKLPQLHSFVDVTVAGRSPKSVSVERVGPKNLVTADVGASSGMATFVYTNATGRYRFSTRILGHQGRHSVFELPRKVETVAAHGGAQKRTAVRMDTIVPGMWRGAKNGKGFGEFVKGNVRDISRGGCSLIIDTEKPRGSQVELKLVLKTNVEPILALAEVMRTDPIESSGKISHGLRFHGISPADDKAIMEFINKKQSDLRSRGLA